MLLHAHSLRCDMLDECNLQHTEDALPCCLSLLLQHMGVHLQHIGLVMAWHCHTVSLCPRTPVMLPNAVQKHVRKFLLVSATVGTTSVSGSGSAKSAMQHNALDRFNSH